MDQFFTDFKSTNNDTNSSGFEIAFNRPFQCEWTTDADNSKDWIYCGGNCFILFGSVILTVLLTVILVKHINQQTVISCATVMKVKTMILSLTIVHEFMVTLRYTFHFHGGSILFYDFILVVQQSVQSIAFFLVCYFFTKKASHFLKENRRLRRAMRVTILVVMILVVVVTFFQSLITQQNKFGLCHTLYFILPSSVNQVVNIFFCIVGLRITQSIQLYNRNQQRIIEGEESLEN